LIISTAQPSSSSFLMTRAVQPSSRQTRGSWTGSFPEGISGVA
jgi:hypothetical protein